MLTTKAADLQGESERETKKGGEGERERREKVGGHCTQLALNLPPPSLRRRRGEKTDAPSLFLLYAHRHTKHLSNDTLMLSPKSTPPAVNCVFCSCTSKESGARMQNGDVGTWALLLRLL